MKPVQFVMQSERVNSVDAPTVASMVRRHLSPQFAFTETDREGSVTFIIQNKGNRYGDHKGEPMGTIEVHHLKTESLLRATVWHFPGTSLEPNKEALDKLNQLHEAAVSNAFRHVRRKIEDELETLGHNVAIEDDGARIEQIRILEPFIEQRTQRGYRQGESFTPEEMGWDANRCFAYQARGKVELIFAAPATVAPQPPADQKLGRRQLTNEEVTERVAWRLWADEKMQADSNLSLKDALKEIACPYSYKLMQQDMKDRMKRAKQDPPLMRRAEEIKNDLVARKEEKKM